MERPAMVVRARMRGVLLWLCRPRRGAALWVVLVLAGVLHACEPAYAQFRETHLPGVTNLVFGGLGSRDGIRTGACGSMDVQRPINVLPAMYSDAQCDNLLGRVTTEYPRRPGESCQDVFTRVRNAPVVTQYRRVLEGEIGPRAYAYVEDTGAGCRFVLDQRRYGEGALQRQIFQTCRKVADGVYTLDVSRAPNFEVRTPRDIGISCSTGVFELLDAAWIGLGVTGLMTVLISAAGLVAALIAALGGWAGWQAYMGRQAERQMADELAAYGLELDWRMDEGDWMGRPAGAEVGAEVLMSFERLMYEAEIRGLSKRKAEYYRRQRNHLIYSRRWSDEQQHGARVGMEGEHVTGAYGARAREAEWDARLAEEYERGADMRR